MVDAPAEASAERPDWPWYLPAAFILAWWLFDLQFQWRTLVDYHYGWMVVVLAAYLVWERWPSRPREDQPASLWLSSGLVMLGTPFVLMAELYKQGIANTPAASFSLSLGCALYLIANLLHLHGWATCRHFLFPLLFLFVAVPLPRILWNPIVLVLQNFITLIDVEVLNAIGIPATQQANVIRLPNCVVGVDEACSGVRSLQSSIMAALFIGALTFKRLGSRLALFAAGIALALAGNFLRSLYLAITAHRHGIGALEGIHDTAGWSILVFTAAGLMVVAWLALRFERRLAGRPGGPASKEV